MTTDQWVSAGLDQETSHSHDAKRVTHGKRLDAADKQWHLTSPTPYDPPLTYGGWINSRTVGARIAAILRDEAVVDIPPASESSSLSSPSPHKRRRRFRIVLHSSPFLRCVQTSVAISAGLASNSTTSPSSPQPAEPPAPSLSSTAPTKTQHDAPISTAAGPRHGHDLPAGSSRHVEKSVLRLDAFLGEWLSPEYFEHITPPPKSALMLATAKAELLRRSSYHDYPHFHAHVHSSTSSHLWNNVSGTHPAHGSHGTSGLDTLSGLADSLPRLEGDAGQHLAPKRERETTHEQHPMPGYVFPVPSYALSTSEPIPRGYVAHARDACVSVDYQWDSSRDTLAWGDGGTLPEEWASMHQRLRRGLRRLVDWYSSTENAAEMVTKMANTTRLSEPDVDASGDQADEIEDVVVLVSHGAGCNALIGALTQQPVLTDVAMSSLTMAKRRAGFDSRNISLTRVKSLSSLDAALHTSRATMPEMYELKLLANTDHLATPSSSSAFNRNASSARPNPRARFNTGYTSALKEINFGSLYGGSTSTGSMRQSSEVPSLEIRPSVYNATTGGITVGSGVSSFSVTRPDRSGSGTWGLWSPRQDDNDREPEPEPPMMLDFSHEKATKEKQATEVKQEDERPANKPASTATTTITTTHEDDEASQPKDQNNTPEHHDEEHDVFEEETLSQPWAGTGSGGLWGAPQPPGEAELLRDFSAHKRRWTVTER
ncbi:hypothetical protein F5B18DRAFT_658526 [Nemania serpens]|nr:hypothetical protein F5B18DRAFT_658526 [Nemania serpens]